MESWVFITPIWITLGPLFLRVIGLVLLSFFAFFLLKHLMSTWQLRKDIAHFSPFDLRFSKMWFLKKIAQPISRSLRSHIWMCILEKFTQPLLRSVRLVGRPRCGRHKKIIFENFRNLLIKWRKMNYILSLSSTKKVSQSQKEVGTSKVRFGNKVDLKMP